MCIFVARVRPMFVLYVAYCITSIIHIHNQLISKFSSAPRGWTKTTELDEAAVTRDRLPHGRTLTTFE